MQISFPNLNLDFNINPTAFHIGSRPIYWYGLIVTSAIAIAFLLSLWLGKKRSVPSGVLLDLFPLVIIAGIIGARLYYVIFNISDFWRTPLKTFAIWEGGIAIYGGVIGGGLAVYYYCRKIKFDFLKVLDIYAPCVLLAQSIGRWGNFFNGEAYGVETNGLFRMEIIENFKNPIIAHPTFLYESFWCLIGAILLLLLPNIFKRFYEKRGRVLYTYMIVYGTIRFFIEGLRTDSLPYGASFKISQILSVIIMILGIYLIFANRRETKKKAN